MRNLGTFRENPQPVLCAAMPVGKIHSYGCCQKLVMERHVFQHTGQFLSASKTGIEVYQIIDGGDYLKVALCVFVVRYRTGAL